MMKSNNCSTTANNTDEILLNKTPQHHHKRIARVTHSSLAAPCAEGVIRRRGGRYGYGPSLKRSSYYALAVIGLGQAAAQVLTDLATIHVLIPENCYQ